MTRGASGFGRAIVTVSLGVWLAGMTGVAGAGVMFGESPANTIGGGLRWDAAPRDIIGLGERSLDGSLRYSSQGGSLETYRDLFQWTVVPSLADFQSAVQQAFVAWTIADPVAGFTTQISFVYDPDTAVIGTGAGGVNAGGAEIDLLGARDAISWDPGDNGTRGESFFNAIGDDVTLTSGTANYAGSGAISGADITFNSNPGAIYSLDFFRRLLSTRSGTPLASETSSQESIPAISSTTIMRPATLRC